MHRVFIIKNVSDGFIPFYKKNINISQLYIAKYRLWI